MKRFIVIIVLSTLLLGACNSKKEKISLPEVTTTTMAPQPVTTTTLEPVTTTILKPVTTTTSKPVTTTTLYSSSLMSYCVSSAKALYQRRSDIGAGKDSNARCVLLLTVNGAAATSSVKLVDKAGVDTEIAYTEAYYDLINHLVNSLTATTTTMPTTTTTVKATTTTVCPKETIDLKGKSLDEIRTILANARANAAVCNGGHN